MLLTRDQFREQVFTRDKNLCVCCGSTAQDAHHIIERRLWVDSGYYLNNGASLCGGCHLKAEMTLISPEELRQLAGIKEVVIPPHMYKDDVVDKWGNPILPNGRRMKGELFFDESVQKILQEGNVLSLFVDCVKYPRTYHLSYSPGISNSDRALKDESIFENKEVVVTEKMDGECTTLYHDYLHARSIDTRSHSSRNWIKQFHAQIKHDIPPGWRICGENLFAQHTVLYDDLESYFYGFSIWNNQNFCISWPETLEWFTLIGIKSVPILYEGMYDKNKILFLLSNKSEGFVIRLKDGFGYKDFNKSCAKYVSKSFKDKMLENPMTFTHWSQRVCVPNKLRSMG